MSDPRAARLRTMLGPLSWAVDGIALVDDELEVQGWLYADPEQRGDLALRVNGRPFERASTPRLRPRLGEALWFIPGAARLGFRLATRLTAAELASQAVVVGVHRTSTGECIDRIFIPGHGSPEANLPLPEGDQIARVANSALQVFRMQGLSIVHQLAAAAQRHGVAFHDGLVALDWGCGCGRVARFWPSASSLIGVDVDAENVRWCSAHLRGTYRVIAAEPPLDVASACVDLVFGISVLSHIPGWLRQAWFAEFDRILRPGGLALLSFLGEHGTARMGIDASDFERLDRDGELFVATQEAIDHLLGDRGLYGTTYVLTPRALEWGAGTLRAVEAVRAGVANHQDLLVLKKRA